MATILTVEELAKYLRVHRSTVYRLLRNKEIPAFKIGSDWRFHQEAINDWLNRAQQAVKDSSR
jgi:excisionase family DNA binding protein